MGQGCSARLVLLNGAWFFYGLSCLWVFPCVMEEAGEIGGKVLFMLSQAIGAALMWRSRQFAEQGALEVARSVQQDQRQMSTLVGAPRAIAEPTKADLQQQVVELQQQVVEILDLQKARMQAIHAMQARQGNQVASEPSFEAPALLPELLAFEPMCEGPAPLPELLG